jgi:single-strand DNA-binding protein
MVNRVTLVGNLGQDPEVKSTSSGQNVAQLRVATTSSYKDREGNRQESTEWHTVVVWGNQAVACGKYLTKGRQVYVEGRIATRKWQDKDGNDRYSTEVVAENVRFLGGPSGERRGDDGMGY